jgi:3-phytase
LIDFLGFKLFNRIITRMLVRDIGRLALVLVTLSYIIMQARGDDPIQVLPLLELHNELAGDQDDLCFWRHPHDPSQSLVIASDKKANRIFSYDLAGKVKQSIELAKPGNIDIRQGIRLGDRQWDIVAVNSRAADPALRVFSVDRISGRLAAIDGNGIPTRPNYGGCLSYDKKQQRLWFFCTSEAVGVTQYELTMSDADKVCGSEVRRWALGKCEGAVADDENLSVFITVESEGIWRVGMLPEDTAPGEKIIPVGRDGLTADLEGIALASLTDGTAAFVVSSQGSDQFFVFERTAPWKLCGTFRIQGAHATDGLDLIQADDFPGFEKGIFGCHTADNNHPILLASWSSILKNVSAHTSK